MYRTLKSSQFNNIVLICCLFLEWKQNTIGDECILAMCHVVSFSAEVFVLLVADFKTSHYKIPWNQNIHTHTVGTERSKLSWGWSDLFSVDKWEHYKRQDIFMAHGKETMLHYVLFRSEIVNTSGTFTWESEWARFVSEWVSRWAHLLSNTRKL